MNPYTGVYAILDTQILRGRDPADLVAECVRGGARLVQVRAKHTSTRDFIDLAARCKTGIGTAKLLINDRVDVALATGADGIHVGREDMPPDVARGLLGSSAIIGVTIKSSEDLAGLSGPVDYGCIGGVYATRHKDNPDAPVGLDGFIRLRREAASRAPRKPVGAIAGITAATAGTLRASGADFIAVVGAVFDAADVEAATRALAVAFAAGGRT